MKKNTTMKIALLKSGLSSEMFKINAKSKHCYTKNCSWPEKESTGKRDRPDYHGPICILKRKLLFPIIQRYFICRT